MSKHYYIPISSMNLETILQSESISPYSYYPQRLTGSTNFELLSEYANCKNVVILLDKPVHFCIHDPNRYNFPMLIEVADDVQLNSNTLRDVGLGVYACSTTINLTPSNCRFIFFERRHHDITTINVRDSRAVKYYRNYSIVAEWSGVGESLPAANIEVELKADNREARFDKIKGFLYANLLGQIKSLSPDLARLRRISQEIYNILVALQSSPGSLNNYRSKLSKLLEEYRQLEPQARQCRESFKEWMNGKDEELNKDVENKSKNSTFWDKVKDILVALDVFGLAESNYAKSRSLCPLPSIEELKTVSDFQQFSDEIMSRYNRAVDNYRQTQPVATLDFIKADGDILGIDCTRYIGNLVEFIIKNNITPTYMLANTPQLCIDVVKRVIQPKYEELEGDGSWDKSDAQQYFLSLYYYIAQNGERFEVHSVKDEELQSIAAFIYAGKDLAHLDNYIKMNEIHNCTYAISLWGALCGYMDMPKDVLQSLLSMDTYKVIYRKMFGEELEYVQFNDLPKAELPLYTKAIKSLNTRGIPHTEDDDTKLRKAAVLEHNKRSPEALLRLLDNALLPKYKAQYKNLKTLLESDNIVLPNDDLEICNFLIKAANIKFNNSKDGTKEQRLAEFKSRLLGCIAKENLQNDGQSMVEIADDAFSKGSKIIQTLSRDLAKPEETEQLSIFSSGNYGVDTKIVKSSTNKSVSDEHLENVVDVRIDEIISNIQNVEGYNPSIEKSIVEFLRNYKPGGYYHKKEKEYPRDNSSVISHLEKWCFYNGNPNHLMYNADNKRIISEICRVLTIRFK